MKALPVYVLTALFLFVLMIMSGMDSVGPQSQLQHAKNTVIKMRMSQIQLISTCHIGPEATYVEQNKRNNSINNDEVQ